MHCVEILIVVFVSLCLLKRYGYRYKAAWVHFGVNELLSLLLEDLLLARQILISSFRSFRAHIHNQFAKGQVEAYFGQAFQFPFGRPVLRNARTIARSVYTKKLRSTFPWVDCPDREIFLMGFDAGEQWCMDLHAGKYPIYLHPSETSSWLTPEDMNEIQSKVTNICSQRIL